MQLEVLIGLIGSGKSTYAAKQAEAGAIIVNDDAIVTAIHGGSYKLYDKKLKPVYKAVENTIVTMGLALGYTVIVDRGTNVSINSRKRWIGFAKSVDVPCIAVVFPVEPAGVHAKRRVEDDDRGYTEKEWLEAVKRFNSQLQRPTLDEGFNDIIFKGHQ